MQNSKVRLITPFLMLFAGALASIIMYIRKYDFYTMLWVLLIVLVVFYIIGDIVRYLYASALPRVIPQEDIDAIMTNLENGILEEDMSGEKTEAAEEAAGKEEKSELSDEEAETEEDSMDDESVEEYTDENLDEM